MRRAVLPILLWTQLAGCAYRVALASRPEPAEVVLPGGAGTVVTPAEVTLRYAPFNKQIVRVRAPGYRTLEVDLRDREIRLGHYVTDTLFHPKTLFGEPRGLIRFDLVPEHGPIGTWDPDEIP